MTDTMLPCPDRVLALGALADGEIDAMAALAIEEHLRTCPGCRAELERIEQLRAMMTAPDLREKAPADLRQRIVVATDSADPIVMPPAARPRVTPWIGGAAIGALAASLTLFLAIPDIAEPGMTGAMVDGQIRSLQSGHLVDVQTSDRHTVKPWFNGRISYAPPVVDLKDKGFPLVGGRLDVIERENVAVLVYRRRLHIINLFIRPVPAVASPLAGSGHRAGYNLVRWTHQGLEYWAISDVDARDLDSFRQAFRAEAGQ